MTEQPKLEEGAASFFGYMGIAAALCFANIGAAYGTAISGVGICEMGISKPELIIKSAIPVIMAGILGIYGLITAILLGQKGIKSTLNYFFIVKNQNYSYYEGFKHLASGCCCGISALGAGVAIGISGAAGVRALGKQDRIFIGMMLILIFAEALGLYGLIISLILSS